MNHKAVILNRLYRVGLPTPQTEYKFARDIVGNQKGVRERLKKIGLKDWRFDYAYPEKKIAIEYEGGVYIQGGHTRGGKYTDDCQKYNKAQFLGWKVFRITIKHLEDPQSLGFFDDLRLLYDKHTP